MIEIKFSCWYPVIFLLAHRTTNFNLHHNVETYPTMLSGLWERQGTLKQKEN